MRIALLTTFQASKKEQLAALLERIHAAFLSSGQGEPLIQFSFSDSTLPGFVSSVDRVLKRYPQLERFASLAASLPGLAPVRQISNGPASPATGQSVEFSVLAAIAAGVPKSFPFHNVWLQFHSSGFGDERTIGETGLMTSGVMVGDSWWISGRKRSLSALMIVDADLESKALPPPPEPLAVVLAACGKAKSTIQVPLAQLGPSPSPARPPAVLEPEKARAVSSLVQQYRTRMAEIVEQAAMPHELPPVSESFRTAIGQTTGPKKPALVKAFQPLGYGCTGGPGTFSLRRRTATNLTVEVNLDVGTWSRLLLATLEIHGLGFKARLPLPVAKGVPGGGQYPIGDAEQWSKLVENLAALVAELERGFVPAVEAAAGPSPEWYQPE
jgi:hypothetical protein